MSVVKQYGIIGINNTVQYGVKGGHIKYSATVADGSGGTAPAFQIRNNSDNALLRLQVGTPIHWSDAVTKEYADAFALGLITKKEVQLASFEDYDSVAGSGDFPLSGTLLGALVDNTQILIGYRILLKNQVNARQNGIWVVTDAGSGNYQLVRAGDADNKKQDGTLISGSEVRGGMYTFITMGEKLHDTGWTLSSPDGNTNLWVPGDNATTGDNLSFVQFSQAGVIRPGEAIKKTGLVLDVLYDNTTVTKDINNKLAVRSNGTLGNLLISTATAGGTAAWGTMDLSSSNAVGSSVLRAINGGTGLNSYTFGDILFADSSTTLKQINKGFVNQVLTVTNDPTNPLQWKYQAELRDSSNNLIIEGSASDTPVNYLTVKSSDTNTTPIIGTAGLNDNIGITVSPKGIGLFQMKSGYNSWFITNELSLSDEAIPTKGFVNNKVATIDTTRIQNAAGTAAFDSDLEGYQNTPAVISRNKLVALFDGNIGLTTGDHFRFTAQDGEVQIKAENATRIGNVDMRLIPQNSGQVFIGSQGAGLIEGENGYQLTIKGGNSSSTLDAGDVVIAGGDGSSSNFNGGKVILKPGSHSGSGVSGKIELHDPANGIVAQFVGLDSGSTNSFQFSSSIADSNPLISGVKINAFGSSSDISIIMTPKGVHGLVRVADGDTYSAELALSGNLEALTTKKYVRDIVNGQTKIAGAGLRDDANVFNINTNATTIKIDGSNNVIVSSTTNVANRTLLSPATAGAEATWGPLPLDSTNAVTGTLSSANGGTGQNSYVQNDILVGDNTGKLVRLPKGPNNSILGINGSGNISYNYIGNLRDTNGVNLVVGTGVDSAINWLTMKNAVLNGAVELGSGGTNQNINIILRPAGTGVVYGYTGYTSNIPNGQREVIVTKGYVDDALLYNTDPLLRRAQLNSSWANTMNIGLPTPNVSGRNVFVNTVTIKVISPIIGATYARVVSGVIELMNFDEVDISASDTYVADLGFDASCNNSQIQIQFYDTDGVTLVTPSGGNIIVSAEYKIS